MTGEQTWAQVDEIHLTRPSESGRHTWVIDATPRRDGVLELPLRLRALDMDGLCRRHFLVSDVDTAVALARNFDPIY